MAYDQVAAVVAGLTVPNSKFYKEEIVANFLHDYPITMKYSPDSGLPLWRKDKFFIDGTKATGNHDQFQGFWVMQNSCNDRLVGERIEEDGNSFWTEYNIAEIKKRMKEKLIPFGLWDEKSFGIYPVMI